MMESLRKQWNRYVANLKAGDWDTWWMTAVMLVCIWAAYGIYTYPC